MFEIFLRILKDKRGALIAYMVGAMVTVEMYIALFPAIRDQAQELDKMMAAFPKGFMEAFGFNSTQALFSRLEAYMSTEYFSFFWPIMVITMMVAFANLMVVTELEKGTIEFSLAQPMSRLKLFFTRYLAGFVYFLIFDVVSIFTMILSAKLHNITYQINNYYTILGVSLLFGMVIFSLACLYSAVFSEKGKAMAFSAATLLGMYVVNILASLNKDLENLKYLSIFYYFSPSTVFANNQIVEWSVPVFAGAIVLFTGIAALWFNHRDIAV